MPEFTGIGNTVSFSLKPLTDKGEPAPIDATSVTQKIVGATGTVEIIDFEVTANEIAGKLRAVAASSVPAHAEITADADMTEGVSTITGMTSEWTVALAPADMATHFQMTEGEQEPPGPAPVPQAARR